LKIITKNIETCHNVISGKMKYIMNYMNMALCYDLHSHSLYSDGVLSPAELLQRAAAQGVDVLALTDHDVTAGIAEAAAAAESVGIHLIPGVEISVTWNKRLLHILGLGIDPSDHSLVQGLSSLRKQRDWRAIEIGKRFEKIGINGVYDGAKEFASGDVISRTHFARYLVEHHYARDLQDAFKRYLKQGKRCYVPCQWATLEDAVNWIRGANGQAVIAHPARYDLGNTLLTNLIGEFREIGGVGIEVVTSSHNHKDCQTMARHAKKFNMLASAGSDFHTPDSSWVELGKLPALPEGCEPIWQSWPASKQVANPTLLH
jgi:3',5'-nucleoside bisphosphate phosphatase